MNDTRQQETRHSEQAANQWQLVLDFGIADIAVTAVTHNPKPSSFSVLP